MTDRVTPVIAPGSIPLGRLAILDASVDRDRLDRGGYPPSSRSDQWFLFATRQQSLRFAQKRFSRIWCACPKSPYDYL